MKNNALNIVFIVMSGIEIILGFMFGAGLLLMGAMLFAFSGVDGAADQRLASTLMVFFLVATIATAIASLILNILCIVARNRSKQTGMELPKGKWITSIVLSGTNLFCLLMLFGSLLLFTI